MAGEDRAPFAGERLTPRDLVTHRSGLPRHDLMWYKSTASREELVRRLRYLEPSADFRGAVQYQNLMYMTAGYLAGSIAGRSWEDLVRERIFAPLGMARSLFSSTAAPCLKCHATGDPNHDKIATAPNFLLAKERLKPDWVERWITDPQAVSPGTSMPSGLFKEQNSQWVFAGPTPPSFQGYTGDHRKLLTDYIFQLTPEEQRKVAASMPHAKAALEKKSSHRQAKTESPQAVTGGSR